MLFLTSSGRHIMASTATRRRLFSTTTSNWSSSSTTLSLLNRPFRIAIIGGGPAGFYTASRLLSLPQSDRTKIDLFELLPTPFGLARFGVAPDHPEVKNCSHKFIETALDPRFTYYGNVQISGLSNPSSSPTSSSQIVPNLSPSPLAYQLPLSSLEPHYDAIVLSYGASLDRSLDIPGEDTLLQIHSARNFVNWYNGHPLSTLDSSSIDLSQTHHVTIIGQGNVALDVARILLKPVDDLRAFDVPEPVLAQLARSQIKKVEIVGRRGPLQLAGTTKELREMLNLPGVGFEIDHDLLNEAIQVVDSTPGMASHRMRKRALGLLAKGAKTSSKDRVEKEWSLNFLRSPTSFLPSSSSTTLLEQVSNPTPVRAVEYALNTLSSPTPDADPSKWIATPSGRTETISTDLVFKSIGYRSIPLPGVPFDSSKGIIKNVSGRVMMGEGEEEKKRKGLYVAGWLGRGPTGVIATTMFEAFALADIVAEDLMRSPRGEVEKQGVSLDKVENGKRVVKWEDWERIDEVERERGRTLGKEREKICSVEGMLEVID